jgi:hypothetical protein
MSHCDPLAAAQQCWLAADLLQARLLVCPGASLYHSHTCSAGWLQTCCRPGFWCVQGLHCIIPTLGYRPNCVIVQLVSAHMSRASIAPRVMLACQPCGFEAVLCLLPAFLDACRTRNSRGSSFAACMGLCIMWWWGGWCVCWDLAPCVYRVCDLWWFLLASANCIFRVLTLAGMLHGLLG